LSIYFGGIIISIIYITSFSPSQHEQFRGHYVEKQAKILSEKLNKKLIVFKPILNSRIKQKKVIFENFNGTDIFTINYPNFFKHFSLYKSVEGAWSFFKKDIKNILEKDKPELIISNDFWGTLKLGNIMSEKYKCQHYCIIHGEDTSLTGGSSLLNRKVQNELNKCDEVIAVSNKIKRFLKRRFNYSKGVRVIGNGLSKEVIMKYSNFVFQKNEILTITSIGNINYNKGFDILIRALSNLKIPFICYIMGDGPYKKQLQKQINKFQLEGQVKFTGNIDNNEIYKYIEKSHFFVLPSRNEAFGIVYLEAMITKNICIGTIGQGCEDFIQNGENGFLVSDDSQITNIIEKNYGSSERFNLVDKAQSTAKEFLWDNNVEQIIQVYKK
jgi:teichuronic acid biosynthesis glycosyltransferase TuaC